ncbi:hypothetical protein SEA_BRUTONGASTER_147 [Gordonia phage BrutonGaster]|uniref:Uncharacterized protein n=1 Tax=Gordonia phage BrutonGaster TaxID=2530116 RepID=A0A482JHV9_9CAUD|nr:hypothetical protein HOV26_gp035 [Gordonia phage BrutonGaster]QBP33361.1 hypothetical protein SEA_BRUTONGASTER_147 [Gordonia phage BrutonGaster]
MTVNLIKPPSLSKNTAGQHFVGSREINRQFVANNPKG